MIPNRKAVRDALIALLVALVLTSVGLMYGWQAIEAPNTWNRSLPVVLLLPIAGLSTLLRRFSADGQHLSAVTYRVLLVLGPLAQFFYYFAIVRLIRRIAAKVKSQANEAESTARSSPTNNRSRQ